MWAIMQGVRGMTVLPGWRDIGPDVAATSILIHICNGCRICVTPTSADGFGLASRAAGDNSPRPLYRRYNLLCNPPASTAQVCLKAILLVL